MESNNTNLTVVEENNTKNKSGREIDIREVGGFLISKLWIIALVVLCCVIVAYLYTEIFITPMYSSSSRVYVSNKTISNQDGYNEDGVYGGDLTVAIQLTKSSEAIFTSYEFCSLVADKLNANENISSFFDNEKGSTFKTFTEFYKASFNVEKITPETVMSCIRVSSDEDKCTVDLSVTTPSPELSAIISATATACMQEHINAINKSDTIVIGDLDKGGRVSTSPSNKHPLRNMVICAVVGLILICAILVCFFIFDDKIKVPDDIQKHLKLNVLGEIPEIEEA